MFLSRTMAFKYSVSSKSLITQMFMFELEWSSTFVFVPDLVNTLLKFIVDGNSDTTADVRMPVNRETRLNLFCNAICKAL